MTPFANKTLFAASFSALFVAAATLAVRQPAVQIQSTAVAGSVHMLAGRGGNIGVSVGPDGVLMIDDEFADLAPQIQAAIDALAGGPRAPRFLINTHHHGDHTGANAIFGRSATVIAHDNVRKRLLAATGAQAMAPEGLPAITYAAGASVHFNGEEVRLLHVPTSHTDGDTLVHFTKSNVVHLGDLFFNGMFPFVDVGSGGSTLGLERSIAELLKSLPPDSKLIPGHGPLATRADLARYHEMLVKTIARVREALEAGKGVDEIVEDKWLAAFDSWSWSFVPTDKYARALATEMAATVKERR